ncbi:glyoxal oxidase precursor [Mycena floridula]|nr:glyoxal oxidase precursor [Mycena floridula]
MLHSLPLISLVVTGVYSINAEWHFVQNGTTGILALEAMIVSPTQAILFDRTSNNPLMINNHSAWGALWDFTTNTASPLDVVSNMFSASGGFLSNGTMVSVEGNPVENADINPDRDSYMGLRIFEPCTDPSGASCTLYEDPKTLHLAAPRWYPSSLRIFDGSLMVVGGIHIPTLFYNTLDEAEDTFEFFPPKDDGIPRPSPFLERTLGANLFPRAFSLPSGAVLMIADNQTSIYNIETDTEIALPDIPNGVRVTNPFDGTATLLPLSTGLYSRGARGTNTIDQTLSSQDPASAQFSRMTLTLEGIAKRWERIGRWSLSMVRAPDMQRTCPCQIPWDRAQMQIILSTLMPNGNIMVAGSNPNTLVTNGTEYHTEFRVECLNPLRLHDAPALLSALLR